jgi:hypothetical protein
MMKYNFKNLFNKINYNINNTYLLYLFFIIIFSFIIIIFCILMINHNPRIVDESNRMNIFEISNDFGNTIRSIYETGVSKIFFLIR